MASLQPPFKWAQRSDKIFISIDLRDVKDQKIDIQNELVSFSATSDKKQYSGQINLFKEINSENSKYEITGMQVRILLIKKEASEDYWPRITKENQKFQNITVDWDKYIDADEEAEEADKGLDEGWDPEMMSGKPGSGAYHQFDEQEMKEAQMQQGGMGGMGDIPGMKFKPNEEKKQ